MRWGQSLTPVPSRSFFTPDFVAEQRVYVHFSGSRGCAAISSADDGARGGDGAMALAFFVPMWTLSAI
jgi:hypothetical protein